MRKKIQKLLESDISAYKIAKDTGVTQSKISGLRSGTIKIENITLAIAEKLALYKTKRLEKFMLVFLKIIKGGFTSIYIC